MKHMLALVAVACLLAAPVMAQSTYSTLLGSVRDQADAAIPNAIVTVTEVNTHVGKTINANGIGSFEVPNLLPVTYDVAIEAPGFKKLNQRGVILEPRAAVRVEAKLEVGTTQTSIEVQAAAPVITTETATVSDAVSGGALRELPMNYRAVSTSPVYLISNLPGVIIDNSFGGSDISIAGSHPVQNEFTVDGFSVISVRSNGPNTQMFPSTEMVSEMRVTSEAATAEYGQVANVTFSSKGGSNQYHGSLFEYLQNDFFNGQVRSSTVS